MPLIEESSYRPPWWLKNKHLSTIIPSIFRKVEGVSYVRERMNTPDQDFIDLDWLRLGNNRLILLLHGLEGGSDRGYMKGVAKYFHQKDWDVVAYNCRGCSGEQNLQPRLYHHGDTDDVNQVVSHVNAHNKYHEVVMIGFSMGGSLILNYLGNQKHAIPCNIKAAVTFSVPCDLKATALELSEKGNGFYRKRFLKKLSAKIRQKAVQYPDLVNADGVEEIDSFYEFESKFTAPIHGFKDADDFYHQASAKNYLKNISVPTLIVNAANDPMFSSASYPIEEVRNLDNVFLEMPKYGGHVGFAKSSLSINWMEDRAMEFVNDIF
jgi:predicted alpha/beta-fold hydrolase